jgi:1,4-alpha-glucan branching enzyme
MGWMHDMLAYLGHPPSARAAHHDRLTFGPVYAWNERFVLPLSHDDVTPARGALVQRMPGDEWQRFANVRVLYGLMWAYPGKKLLFMGCEFAQAAPWRHDGALEWGQLDTGRFHRGVQSLVRDLNRLYRAARPLHELDHEPAGFEWIDASDAAQSVVAFVRYARDPNDLLVCVCNFTPVPRRGYRIGVPRPGFYAEVVNTDGEAYGGSNVGNGGGAVAERVPWHGRAQSIVLTLPPLAALWLRPLEP